MQAAIYLITIAVFAGTTLIVFGMKYASAAAAARARRADDDAWRSLAEKATAAQSETQATLAALQADLAKVQASLEAVETILKQVG